MNLCTLLLAQPDLNAPLSAHFLWLDWVVLVGYLVLVSVLGVVLAGRQKDMTDFFRGGDKLPWYAVSASIIATTISAVTFVGVPSVAFSGNFTYLQLGLVAGLISRLFIAGVLVPAYYQRRVYSPYDYIGYRLGAGAKEVTTALFSLGGLLAQSARVYLTALVLQLVLAEQLNQLAEWTGVPPLISAIVVIGIIAVIWTMLGGIATVVWTDAMLFLVFLTGGIAAVVVIVMGLPGGWAQLVEVGQQFDKFKLFDLQKAFSLTEPYTLAAAGFAVVVGNIGAYGTDQLLAQRIFCCRDQRSAKVAMLTSYAGEGIAALMLLVGVGLFVFYSVFPEKLTGPGALAVAREPDKIFPVFILQQIPVGVTGLIIAGIFAAAISSLTSILAALAQTTLSAVYLPWRAKQLGATEASEEALLYRDPDEGRRIIFVSRVLIVLWGVALCAAAVVVDEFKSAAGVPILDLALGLASYIVGGLFAAFLLAWLPLQVNGRGLVWAAPLSVMTVFACRFHEPWAWWVCGVAATLLLATWLITAVRARQASLRSRRLLQTGWLVVGCALLMLVTWRGYFYAYDEAGSLQMSYPLQLNAEGQPIADPAAEPVYFTHPITGEALLDEGGHRILHPSAQPMLRDTERGEPVKVTIAWPWYAPIGGAVALLFGYLLADRRERPAAQSTESGPNSPSSVGAGLEPESSLPG